MRKVGLFEAKQKLSELVERAAQGERIGITKRGRLVAVIGPTPADIDMDKVFAGMEEIRRRAKPLQGVTIKDLITEGRK